MYVCSCSVYIMTGFNYAVTTAPETTATETTEPETTVPETTTDQLTVLTGIGHCVSYKSCIILLILVISMVQGVARM